MAIIFLIKESRNKWRLHEVDFLVLAWNAYLLVDCVRLNEFQSLKSYTTVSVEAAIKTNLWGKKRFRYLRKTCN